MRVILLQRLLYTIIDTTKSADDQTSSSRKDSKYLLGLGTYQKDSNKLKQYFAYVGA